MNGFKRDHLSKLRVSMHTLHKTKKRTETTSREQMAVNNVTNLGSYFLSSRLRITLPFLQTRHAWTILPDLKSRVT